MKPEAEEEGRATGGAGTLSPLYLPLLPTSFRTPSTPLC